MLTIVIGKKAEILILDAWVAISRMEILRVDQCGAVLHCTLQKDGEWVLLASVIGKEAEILMG